MSAFLNSTTANIFLVIPLEAWQTCRIGAATDRDVLFVDRPGELSLQEARPELKGALLSLTWSSPYPHKPHPGRIRATKG